MVARGMTGASTPRSSTGRSRTTCNPPGNTLKCFRVFQFRTHLILCPLLVSRSPFFPFYMEIMGLQVGGVAGQALQSQEFVR